MQQNKKKVEQFAANQQQVESIDCRFDKKEKATTVRNNSFRTFPSRDATVKIEICPIEDKGWLKEEKEKSPVSHKPHVMNSISYFPDGLLTARQTSRAPLI